MQDWQGLATSSLPMLTPTGSSAQFTNSHFSLRTVSQVNPNNPQVVDSSEKRDRDEEVDDDLLVGDDNNVDLQLAIEHEFKRLKTGRISTRSSHGLAHAVKKIIKGLELQPDQDWVAIAHRVSQDLKSRRDSNVIEAYSTRVPISPIRATRYALQRIFSRVTRSRYPRFEVAIGREARRVSSKRLQHNTREGLVYVTQTCLQRFDPNVDWVDTIYGVTQGLKAAYDSPPDDPMPGVSSVASGQPIGLDPEEENLTGARLAHLLFGGSGDHFDLPPVVMYEAKRLGLNSMPPNSCQGISHIIARTLKPTSRCQNWVESFYSVIAGFKITEAVSPKTSLDDADLPDHVSRREEMINRLAADLTCIGHGQVVSNMDLLSILKHQTSHSTLADAFLSDSVEGFIEAIRTCITSLKAQENWVDTVSSVGESIKARYAAEVAQQQSEVLLAKDDDMSEVQSIIDLEKLDQEDGLLEPIPGGVEKTVIDPDLDVNEDGNQDTSPPPPAPEVKEGLRKNKRQREDSEPILGLSQIVNEKVKKLKLSPLVEEAGDQLCDLVDDFLEEVLPHLPSNLDVLREGLKAVTHQLVRSTSREASQLIESNEPVPGEKLVLSKMPTPPASVESLNDPKSNPTPSVKPTKIRLSIKNKTVERPSTATPTRPTSLNTSATPNQQTVQSKIPTSSQPIQRTKVTSSHQAVPSSQPPPKRTTYTKEDAQIMEAGRSRLPLSQPELLGRKPHEASSELSEDEAESNALPESLIAPDSSSDWSPDEPKKRKKKKALPTPPPAPTTTTASSSLSLKKSKSMAIPKFKSKPEKKLSSTTTSMSKKIPKLNPTTTVEESESGSEIVVVKPKSGVDQEVNPLDPKHQTKPADVVARGSALIKTRPLSDGESSLPDLDF